MYPLRLDGRPMVGNETHAELWSCEPFGSWTVEMLSEERGIVIIGH